jgi:hypothetical protein
MLWIGGQITPLNIIKETFLASVVAMVVPTLIISFLIKGNITLMNHSEESAEFKANASWMKFGFHADTTTTTYGPNYSTSKALAQYEYCYQNVKRFAGTECFDRIPRIHYFNASSPVVKSWQASSKAPSPLGFLSADDARTTNYYLVGEQLNATYNCDEYDDGEYKLSFFRTDMRLENDANPLASIQARAMNPTYSGQQEVFIIFTHEPLLAANLSKLESLNRWFLQQGYSFDFPQNRIFKNRCKRKDKKCC